MIVNKKFEEVKKLPKKVSRTSGFSEGLAAFCKDGKWGFISTDGSIAIHYQFEDVGDFNTKGCVFTSTNSRWALIKLYKYNH